MLTWTSRSFETCKGSQGPNGINNGISMIISFPSNMDLKNVSLNIKKFRSNLFRYLGTINFRNKVKTEPIKF